ncbi:MAG TPA: hypothetical protein VGP72_11695 [Planctomycetota bacterium]
MPSDLIMTLSIGIAVLCVAVLVAGSVLRLACRLSGVKAPILGKAIWVAIFAWIAQTAAGFGASVGLALIPVLQRGNLPPALPHPEFVVPAISFFVTACVPACVYKSAFSTSFWRGLLIWFMQDLIYVVLALAIFGIAIAIAALKLHGVS